MGMLERAEYVDLAPASPGTTRYNHEDCPAGMDTKRRLYVTKKEDGSVLAYCHNCGRSGVCGSPRSYRGDYLRKTPAAVTEVEGLCMDHFIDDYYSWPPEAVGFMKKVRMGSRGYIDKWKIMYNATSKRVVIPTYDVDTGELVMFQERAVYPGQEPKYLTYREPGRDYNQPTIHTLDKGKDVNQALIVEDQISAMRCAEIGIWQGHAIPLHTSKASDELLVKIARDYDKVGVWLDNDGVHVNRNRDEIARSLKGMGLQVIVIYNHPQPKDLRSNKLAEILTSFSERKVGIK